MDNLLINSNQMRMARMPFSDDPFDENQNIGMAHENLFILSGADVTTVYIDSRVLTQREITECTHIVIMDYMSWCPQSV